MDEFRSASVSTILFDLDGVLVQYSRHHRLAALSAETGVASSRLHQILFEDGLEFRYDCGELDSNAYLQALSEASGVEISEPAWIRSRCAGMVFPTPTRGLLNDLAARFELAILTNNGPMIVPVIEQTLASAVHWFGGRLHCSGTLGVAKPAPAVFQATLSHLRRDASAVLFLDDLPENVAAAQAVGMQGWTVSSPFTLSALFATR